MIGDLAVPIGTLVSRVEKHWWTRPTGKRIFPCLRHSTDNATQADYSPPRSWERATTVTITLSKFYALTVTIACPGSGCPGCPAQDFQAFRVNIVFDLCVPNLLGISCNRVRNNNWD